MELDDADCALLAALQSDARTPQATLAAMVGLSTAAVNRRLQRLNQQGLINRVIAVLNPERLGQALTVITQISVIDERPDALHALERQLSANPHVQQCYYVTGEFDFVVICVVAGMGQYHALARELLTSSGNVRRYTSSVVMHQAKVTLDVAIAAL